MKKIVKSLLVMAVTALIFTACEKTENVQKAPELPPYNSMKLDFGDMATTKKLALENNTAVNFAAAGITITAWNVMLTVTLAVPVGAFYHSFSNEPVYLGDQKWQWTYDVNVFGGKYNARLTGTIRTDDVKWEMYVGREGIGAHEEFLWFEGTSNLDGNSGQWLLYHSYDVQEAILQVDWQKTGDKIGSITYTYVRESDNGSNEQLAKDSYLAYGLQDATFDAFYNVHYVSRENLLNGFNDVNIEWSTSMYNGRIKAEHYFQDIDWHCWDSNGYDTTCE